MTEVINGLAVVRGAMPALPGASSLCIARSGGLAPAIAAVIETSGPRLYQAGFAVAEASAPQVNQGALEFAYGRGIGVPTDVLNVPLTIGQVAWREAHIDYLRAVELPRMLRLINRFGRRDEFYHVRPLEFIRTYLAETALIAAIANPNSEYKERYRRGSPVAMLIAAERFGQLVAGYPSLQTSSITHAIKSLFRSPDLLTAALDKKERGVLDSISAAQRLATELKRKK